MQVLRLAALAQDDNFWIATAEADSSASLRNDKQKGRQQPRPRQAPRPGQVPRPRQSGRADGGVRDGEESRGG